MTRISVALLICFTLIGCDVGGIAVAPGEELPEFTLPDLKGSPFSLVKQRGKVVIINFWASWCQPCIQEIPDLQRLQSKLKGEDVVILGIASQDIEKDARALVEKFGVTYKVVFDSDGTIARRYSVGAFPETFVVDKEGKLVMVADPKDGMPVAKILGPRNWSAPRMLNQIKSLL